MRGDFYCVLIQVSMSNPREILCKIEELAQRSQALKDHADSLRKSLAKYQSHVIVSSEYGYIVRGPMNYSKAKQIEHETNLDASYKEFRGEDKAYRDLVTCVPWKWTDHEEFTGELVCPDLWDEHKDFRFSDDYPRSTFLNVDTPY